VLSKVEGLEVAAPRRSGKETFCCGHGGSAVSRLNPKLADEIARERANELGEEAKLVITACPTCKMALEGVGDFKVLDLVEFIHDLPRDEDARIEGG